MGCVQSLFNPSKSRSPSPEKEFVPPTFETVVVTRQPKKSKSANDDDDAAEVTSRCDDFERHALEDGGDDHSVHYVEATAVRTLAANTGSVAILGTTAKCKSVDGSPASHHSLSEKQHTWSPSATVTPVACSTSQPQLEVRYVEATAVRTLAADTGSIAILGTTADPKPQPHQPPPTADKDAETGSVHYVEATAVRHLAAETGSIAILASTAAVAAPGQQAPGADADSNLIPEGVREMLDSEPRQLQQQPEEQQQQLGQGELGGEQHGGQQQEPGQGDLEQKPLIPLPVILAMEKKTDTAAGPKKIFDAVASSSAGKPQYSPKWMTVDDGGDVGTVNGSVSDALSRRPLIRQANKTQIDNEDNPLSDGWMPKVPVFAKCAPAKSKSLPSKDPTVADASKTAEDKSEKQCGVIRGSSLPYDTDNNKAEQLVVNSVKRKNDEGLIGTKFDKHVTEPSSMKADAAEAKVVESNTNKHSEMEMDVIKQDVLELNDMKSNEYKPTVVELNEDKLSVVESNKDKPTVVELNEDKSSVVELNKDKPTAVEQKEDESSVVESNKDKPTAVELNEDKSSVVESNKYKPTAVELNEDKSSVVESNKEKPTTVELNDVELGTIKQNMIEPKGIVEAQAVGSKAIESDVTATEDVVMVETNEIEMTETMKSEKLENKQPKGTAGEGVDDDETVVGADGESAGQPQQPVAGVGEKSVSGESPEFDADAEYRLTMIQSVREAVNRICEQAVEKTAAIVNSGRGRARGATTGAAASTVRTKRDAADDSEAADYASSDFSLPPPPPPQSSDSTSTGQESSWPPPPPLSEADEERTIAPGFSFDLPDPPTEMDQMDSETDKLDISDEEMRATGLPSDEDDKTDNGEAEAYDDADIVAMKSTSAANGTVAATATAGTDDGAASSASDGGAGDRAATTIQAVYRGFRARKYVETVNAAAVKIQAGFRGYRVRQSLKNAAPSTTTTTPDDSQCWSDDDQKSVVSVTYAPLKESAADGQMVQQQRGSDGSDDDDDDDPQLLQSGDDEVFENDGGDGSGLGETSAVSGVQKASAEAGAVEVATTSVVPVQDGDEDDDEVEALTNAAIKIQARVRGFATRKRLNDEKNGAGAVDKGGDGSGSVEKQ